MKEPNNIYNCDCLDGMRDKEDESADSVDTDPPYGIGKTHLKGHPLS